MARFVFKEDPKGGVGLEIFARDRTEAYNAAATALCLYMWEQETVEEREAVPISWYGFNESTLVVGLLSELLYQMDAHGWVFKRFVTEKVEAIDDRDGEHLKHKQLKITGTAYGERHDPARHRRRFPVQAVLLPRLKLRETEDGGVRLYCVLDVPETD
ncbi:archease [Inmirania thermothiophila]|uniref:SHS2 domain-containing protein n=1 Tax=Inmirania thermothiophila TaxID=1750597 RepID=A0A3N1XZE7_9GAMM|nr:archease [Inmirania thermothiophila]ROR31960.1 SHS2 domain-containing protein [Inmirania thermothiophila]